MSRALLCALLPFFGASAFAQSVVEQSPRPQVRGEPAAATAVDEAATLREVRPKARDPRSTRPLALAHDAMRAGDWSSAFIRAAGDGPVASDVIRWHALRSGRGTADQVSQFLSRNSDWPGLPYLKENTEALMLTASAAQVRSFFKDHKPRTGTGALGLARVLRSEGQEEEADAVLVEAWRTLALEPAEHDVFVEEHGDLLSQHHWARLDHTLWEGWTTNPRRMEGLVSEDQWTLAQARMGLRASGSAGDIPDALKDDPGLAYERYRRLKGKAKRDALLARSTSAEALGRPEHWAPPRRSMARQLMRDGQLALAYRVASTHFTESGRDYADLEWLSGYLALRLGKPEQALQHFKRFDPVAISPISAGRAGYWLGRAYEALGDSENAQAAYARGAKYQTSFYGLLAAEKAGHLFPQALSGQQPEADWATAKFTGSSVHKAALLLLAAGEEWPAERFWTHLAESQSPEQLALMGKMLDDLGQSHIQVMVGKRAAQRGLEIAAPYYALSPLAEGRWPVPTELVLAIARRESEFDPVVVSHAGARGLMQLMPGTAQDVARDLSLPYSRDRLTSDPAYNALLGSEYLRQMSRAYGGNPVLISIAYNAGPGRANRWQQAYGNPRDASTDIVDWIEGIPFRETRNYVMRVAESLPVYRARLGLDPLPEPFSAMLKGSSLRPRAVEGE